jgi:tetratricopeptide (TPR) repeat protein
LGVLAVSVSKPLEAIPFFKIALESNPQIEQFWLSYIDALIKLARFDEAKRVSVEGEKSGVSLEKLDALKQRLQGSVPNGSNKTAKGQTLSEKRKKLAEKKKSKERKVEVGSSNTEPSQGQINQLIEHYQAGRLEEAEVLAVSLTQQFPSYQIGWKILGAHLKQAGRLSESLKPMQKSVELAPQDADAHNDLGVTLQELGRLDEAKALLRQAIRLKPDFAEAHNNLGATLQHLGEYDEAAARYRQSIALQPSFAEAHNNLAATFQHLDKYYEAEASYRQAIALRPDFTKAYSNLGVMLQELGRLDEAEARLRDSIELSPTFAEAYSILGVILQELGRINEARASFTKAVSLNPEFAEAHRFLALVKKFVLPDQQFSQMQTLFHDPRISDHDRCHICFTLAKAFDDIEDIASAYQFYAEGNALRRKQVGYYKVQAERLFESLETSYKRISAHAFESSSGAPRLIPIFLVGMPRSGTTLVEQIISSHQQVMGAGELPFVWQFGGSIAVGQTPVSGEALKTFREQYLSALRATQLLRIRCLKIFGSWG